MARELLAYSDIFDSFGTELVPEEFVVILSGSKIKVLQSFFNFYGLWRSSWSYPLDSEWDVIDAYIGEINFRLGGESVYQISNKLNEINTTLQEIRDKMGDGSGDGSGNTIQDLIFWLKVLFAVTGAGLESPTTTPILSLIKSAIDSGNEVLGGVSQNVLETKNNAELELIADKIQALVDKDCSQVTSVSLPDALFNQSYDLIKNGDWSEGDDNGIVGAFYPHFWLVVGEAGNGEYPTRTQVGDDYVLGMITETAPIVRQSAVVPPGYHMPKIIVTLPTTMEFEGADIRVYVNNSLANLEVVESTVNYFEADFNAAKGDVVKVELTASNQSSAKFGRVELLVWPTQLPVTSVVEIPTIGGALGKGRVKPIKPDTKLWTIDNVSNPAVLSNWVVEKIYSAVDWFSLRLKASKTVAQSLAATRIINLGSSTSVCHLRFNTFLPGNGTSQITIDAYDGSAWQNIKNCELSSTYAIKVDFGEWVGERLVRVTLDIQQAIDGGDFDLYDFEIEEVE